MISGAKGPPLTPGWQAFQHHRSHSLRLLLPNRAAKSSRGGSESNVYIAHLPLVGLESIENLPPALSDPVALHEAVIIENAKESMYLFDFLPRNPTNPLVLASLMSGASVKGQARARKLEKLPTRRCRKIKESCREDAIQVAMNLQKEWDNTELRLFQRDCRHFVQALLKELL